MNAKSLALVGSGLVLLVLGILILGQVVALPSSLPLLSHVTTTKLRFFVKSQGVALAGAEVHVTSNSGLVDVRKYTDSSGYAEITVPNNQRDFHATITKTGYSTYTKDFCAWLGTVSLRFDVDLNEEPTPPTPSFDQTFLGAALSSVGGVLLSFGVWSWRKH